jgi:predicted nucleic acid-binding protein
MNAVDTNILIYSFDRDSPAEQRIAQDLVATTKDGLLLWQVACEFIAASRKLAVQGFTAEMAWTALGHFLNYWPLVLPTRRVLDEARVLHLDQQWSYWDALLISASLEAGVKRIYSQDLPGRAPPRGLDIINPFA